MSENKILVWFRNDLRLHDQEALFKASQKTAHIIPVYCFDTRQFAPTSLGFPKTDSFRAKFLVESVIDLRKNLQKIGSDLIVRIGNPEEIIPELAFHFEVSAVYTSKEVTTEEIQIEEELEKKLWLKKIPVEFFRNATLYHIEDLPYPINSLPDVFTTFRKDVEKFTKVRKTLSSPSQLAYPCSQGINIGQIPSLEQLGLEEKCFDERAAIRFEGGETAGLRRLQEFIWDKQLIQNYKDARNGLLGADYSSKFSAWLSTGCLSARYIYEQVKLFERREVKNDSTYWLVFELIWRDYFRFVAKKYKNKIFQKSGIRQESASILQDDFPLFEKWTAGMTGVPFIDANMRELKLTGFMSNRGRQNVASFLVKDLQINWVWGAMYFESKLIDYDVCSNWGNWMYVAGVGNDPRENRYFNILNQAKRYDSKGNYVKHWLPELQNLPTQWIHQPDILTLQDQKKLDFRLGIDYPNALVKSEKWFNNA